MLIVDAAIRSLPSATARARLVGLPHKVETDELELEADTTQLLTCVRGLNA